ncbi:MAG: hypothetical protein L6311_09985 [Cellulomonas sp.]|nr:hypothetical protein [Cellulomonas sp.]
MRDRAGVDSELIAVRRLPYGRARTLTAERILAEVQADGPAVCEAFAALVLLESYHHAGEPLKALVPFTQVVRLADEHPDRLDEGDWQMLLWSFKWLLIDLAQTPQVPVARVDGLIEDMARRFAVAGAGSDAVAFVRSRWADVRGAADAEEIFDRWVATPRDEYSQCEVCDPGDRAAHLLAVGRDRDAVRLMEGAVESGATCLSEPADMLSRLALAYLDLGRDAEAVTAHRRTLAALDGAAVDLVSVRGRVIQFLARAGAVRPAVRRIEQDQRLLDGSGVTALERLGLLVQVGSSARALAALAPGTAVRLTVVGAGTLEELAAWCRATAEPLARAFDERHGTDGTSRWVDQAWRLMVRPLDLSVLPGTAVPGTAGGTAEPSRTGGPSAPEGGDAVRTPAPASVEDVGSLLARAEAVATERPAQAVTLYASAAEQLVDQGLLADAGFALAEAAHCAQVLDDDESAHRTYQRAVGLLEAGGVPPEVRGGVLRAWAATAADIGGGSALLDRLAVLLVELGEPAVDGSAGARRREAADVQDTCARLLAAEGLPDQAVDRAVAAADEFDTLGAVQDGAHASWLAGRLLRDLGRTQEAVERLERATAQFAAVGAGRERAAAVDDLVEVLRAAGRSLDAERAARSLLG